MKKCLYVEQLQNGYFQVMTMGSEMLLKAGPVLVNVENLYQYAKENGFTDICIIAGYLHLGGDTE